VKTGQGPADTLEVGWGSRVRLKLEAEKTMSTTTSRTRRTKIAGLAMLPIAAIVLGACGPAPAPAPAPTVACDNTASTMGAAVEQCHLKYRSYSIDTTNSYAQTTALYISNFLSRSACSTSLASYHNTGTALLNAYRPSTMVAENLYCSYFSSGACPSAQLGATQAMNGWLKSPGHKANMDNFAGKWVNGGAVCNPYTGVYVAVAQFHN
jgi:hypothetical protein